MMKRAWVLLLLIAIMSLPASSFGQFKSQQKGKVNFASLLSSGQGSQSLFGILGLDPSRFHMSQSYTLAVMSMGGKSYSQGIYLNRMSYQFESPVTLNLEWGVMNSPLASVGLNSPFKNGFFLSGASLEYKPSENFQIGIQYSNYPLYSRPYSSRSLFWDRDRQR